MIRNIFRHSVRSFKRQGSYIFINVLGLAIGIACSLLIALYIINEFTYDRYNIKKDRIYRAVLNGNIGGQKIVGAYTPAVMGPTLVREFPEVEDFLRMTSSGPTVMEFEGKTYTEDNLVEADSSFFNFFSVPVLKGDPENLLNADHRAVISESAAKRIFGNLNPIDKALKIGTDSVRYIISGVMADIPEKSHFKASIITSFMTDDGSRNPVWLSNSYALYLLLRPNTSYKAVDDKFPELLKKYVGPEVTRFMGISLEEFEKKGNVYGFFLQRLTDIHLNPNVQQHFKPSVDPKYLKIFGSIAILIVLIAAINFMNLATAQASKRAKEVGVKKVAGSTRGMLIIQFLSESFLLSLAALVISIVLIRLSLPYFNDLLDINLTLSLFSAWYTIPVIILFALFVGLLAGSYPSFFLSSFNPYEVLKGSRQSGMKNGNLRRVLVVFQFAVSILLIIGTLVMYRQINYMLNKDVGFNKEQLVVLERADAIGKRMKSFKNELMQVTGVVNVAGSTAVPGRNNNNNGYGMEGRKEESFLLQTAWVDYDFIKTYGMKLTSGRSFDESFTSDKEACMINESAVRKFAIKDPLTTRFIQPGEKVTYLPVVGVVSDFNFVSLRNPIDPYMFKFQNDNMLWGYITIRLSSQDYAKTIAGIESKWKEFLPNTPLQYYFVDQDFEMMYLQEKQNAQMAIIFSVLAIFIAALGLYGLTSFTVEQRTKEIGVRKAMGSSITGIYVEISKEIIILVSVSALIAWPLVYYLAGKWLENFYFRINPGLFSFVSGLLIAISIAVMTISYRIMKAARINPAQSLKYE